MIVCEGDSDCRFYQAILDVLLTSSPKGTRNPDVLFTHCGGKDRIHVAASALRAVGVSVRVIVDFDILSAKEPLQKLVSSCSGEWANMKHNWSIMNDAIQSKRIKIDSKILQE